MSYNFIIPLNTIFSTKKVSLSKLSSKSSSYLKLIFNFMKIKHSEIIRFASFFVCNYSIGTYYESLLVINHS